MHTPGPHTGTEGTSQNRVEPARGGCWAPLGEHTHLAVAGAYVKESGIGVQIPHAVPAVHRRHQMGQSREELHETLGRCARSLSVAFRAAPRWSHQTGLSSATDAGRAHGDNGGHEAEADGRDRRAERARRDGRDNGREAKAAHVRFQQLSGQLLLPEILRACRLSAILAAASPVRHFTPEGPVMDDACPHARAPITPMRECYERVSSRAE